MAPQIDDVTNTVINSEPLPVVANNDSVEDSDEDSDGTVVEGTVVEATTVEKPKSKKPKQVVKPDEKPVDKKEKKSKKTVSENDTEAKLVRPPMDIITRDFEQMITDHEIGGNGLKKLGYKCGKILFGIPSNGDGKDFRIIAYKARKKSHTVAGKSRCIFYFGLVEDASKHAKEITGAMSSKFGKCAVQSKTPVQLVLDKVAYKETFEQDADKVTSSLEKLINLTIKQRTASWKEIQKKKKETESTKDE